MVRFLKKKTITPALPSDGGQDGAPVLSTTYTYKDLASLVGGDDPHAVVITEEAHDETSKQLLERTSQSYIETKGAHYGRQNLAQTTLNGITTTTRYSYEIKDDLLFTHVTIEGFEGDAVNRSTSSDARSLVTGLTALEQSPAGVKTQYDFDELGRVTRTVIAQDTDFQAQRTCDYHIDDTFIADNLPPSLNTTVAMEERDATGQRRRSWLDGHGQVVLVQLEDLDNAPGTFRDVAISTYDPLGRITTQTSLDWFPDVTEPLRLTNTIEYDDWGTAARQTSPSGVISHTRYDPVTLRTEQWQESPSGKLSSKQVMLSNVAGSPLEQQLYDEQGRLVRTTRSIRDGLDRIIEERVISAGSQDLITRYSYDAYSRVTERLLPDGTRITLRYAAHSDSDHPESLQVTAAQVRVHE
ncbi:hypothetical protein D3C77_349300 [compost metagenome]